MVRVLLTSRYPMMVKGMQGILSPAPDIKVVGEALSLDEVIQKYRQMRPDVVVGEVVHASFALRASAQFGRRFPEARRVVLTSIGDPEYARSMIANGVLGYVLKSSTDKEMISAVRHASQGRSFLDPGLVAAIASLTSKSKRTSFEPRLSSREVQVLRALVQGHTNAQIARQLSLSVKTVETYRARIYTKLELKSRFELVQYAIAQGLLTVNNFDDTEPV